MRAARLAEAANNGVVVRFHENQPRGNLTADARIDSREPLEALALADVHHQRGEPDGCGIARQLGKLGNQPDGQIID